MTNDQKGEVIYKRDSKHPPGCFSSLWDTEITDILALTKVLIQKRK